MQNICIIRENEQLASLPFAIVPAVTSPVDTLFALISTALVLLMTPALALFYGGLVRAKNILNTMMMSLAAIGLVGVLWAVVGYSIAFAPGGAFVGGVRHVGLSHIGLDLRDVG